MQRRMVIQGRELTAEDVRQVQRLVTEHPGWSRYRLSVELAEMWDWRSEAGRLKDMAARTLLAKLQTRGLVRLPPPRRPQVARRIRQDAQRSLFEPEEQAVITGTLRELGPVALETVQPGMAGFTRLERYLAEHHYLGYRGHVGENLAYLARDGSGRDLACLLFGAAAWRTQPRDALIGWDDATRAERLSRLTNNTRFLVLPWVRIPHLASCVLGMAMRRLAQDWDEKYGHPVYLVETYVDRERFRGTCYRAANWQLLGQTQGRSRQDRYKKLRVPIKDVYVYPLTRRFRERLTEGD